MCLSLEILPRREKHSLAYYLLSFLSSATSQWPSSLHHSIITLTVSKQDFIHSFSSPSLFCTFLQEMKTTLSSQSQSQIIVKIPKHMQSTVYSSSLPNILHFHEVPLYCWMWELWFQPPSGYDSIQCAIHLLLSVNMIFCNQWRNFKLYQDGPVQYLGQQIPSL